MGRRRGGPRLSYHHYPGGLSFKPSTLLYHKDKFIEKRIKLEFFSLYGN